MWSCAMLMPRRRTRSLEAHLSIVIAALKSAMMGAYGSGGGAVTGALVATASVRNPPAMIVRVT